MVDDPSELKRMQPVDIDAALDAVFSSSPQIVKQLQTDSRSMIHMVGLIMKTLGSAADPSVIRQKIQDRL